MSLDNILGLDKKLVMTFKQVYILLKMSFKLLLSLENKQKKIILVEWGWNKKFPQYESYGKKMNTI